MEGGGADDTSTALTNMAGLGEYRPLARALGMHLTNRPSARRRFVVGTTVESRAFNCIQ